MRIGIAALALLLAAPAPAAAQELRIGFVNTLSGSGAILGQQQLNGFRLGLEHEGWTKDGDAFGGVPMRLIVADDQLKTDVALTLTQRLIEQDKVQIVAGFFFTNMLMSAQRPILDAKRVLLVTNAGSSQLAGSGCSRFVVSASFNNDQFSEALGQLMNEDGVKNVVLFAPNFQGGKDMITGFQRYYKGQVLDQILFKLGQTDFQPEISKIRGARPESIFVFAPGAMGIAFMKQWEASGAGRDIKLYSVGLVDWAVLPALGKAAVGTYHTAPWDAGSAQPVNQEFVKAYRAKHNGMPAFYAAFAYDAARLAAAAVKAAGGKVDDAEALARTMRRVAFPSVRPAIKFNVNGMPIQTWYKREVVLAADGAPAIVTRQAVLRDQKDAYWEQCPAAERF